MHFTGQGKLRLGEMVFMRHAIHSVLWGAWGWVGRYTLQTRVGKEEHFIHSGTFLIILIYFIWCLIT